MKRKTKTLISFAVTAKLIFVFVFAYAKSRFSHDEALIVSGLPKIICQNNYKTGTFKSTSYSPETGGAPQLFSMCIVFIINLSLLCMIMAFQTYKLTLATFRC